MHEQYMRRAMALANKGLYTTTPNPRVGCVIVKDNVIVGEGYHEKAGQPHAEVYALAMAGDKAKGATVYVTLEPCSHYGRTPPCADALIAAGIAAVMVGSRDPNPQVSGRGVAKLRDAGVTVTTDFLREDCDSLNRGFLKRMTTGLPYVRVKMGMTLDAKIATASGESQWITGEAARADVQHLRAQSCAVMSSSATVIADNPSLNVRLDNVVRQPKRVIIDTHLSVPAHAKLFDLVGDILIYHCQTQANPTEFNDSTTYVAVPEKASHVDLAAVLQDLGDKQCNEVLVEAGGVLAAALLAHHLVDELIIYQAPMLLGHTARPAFAVPSVEQLAQAQRFTVADCRIIGNDVKTVYMLK